ncbi:uncharacterized protein LOC115364703 isoform X3 [Myripristis murdjan]|nr:uncharacterized protein LOC115364703 isoform X3 [Myripristis murdjan]XP_029915117.1 uncharacterized protein LOC115364703 isoform X3 [Myripristis murdjan]
MDVFVAYDVTEITVTESWNSGILHGDFGNRKKKMFISCLLIVRFSTLTLLFSKMATKGDNNPAPIHVHPPAIANSISSTDTNQEFAASFIQQTVDNRQTVDSRQTGDNRQTVDNRQRCQPPLPCGKLLSGSVLDQALQLGLPRHLLLQHVRHRSQTSGSKYSTIQELLSDMLEPPRSPFGPEPEVPMLTNQLEDTLREMERLQAGLFVPNHGENRRHRC